MKLVYLDNNATTALAPVVHKKFNDALERLFANPSSVHRPGQEARSQLVEARRVIASCLGVHPQEIVFTASATEAANLLIRGYLGARPAGHVITSTLEHAAVFETFKDLAGRSLEVQFLAGSAFGAISCEEVEHAIRPDTRLICLMAANNETGVMTDIQAIAALASSRKIPFIVDAVALFGKEPLVIPEGVSAMFFGGHKFHAPKGAAFLFIRKTFPCLPLITGGDQEGGRRAGTENVPAIVACSEAVRMCSEDLPDASGRMKTLRDYFEQELMKRFPNVQINGQGPRICNTSNLCFEGIDGEALLLSLDLRGIAASLGSACASGGLEPSRVLLNMGLDRKRAASSLRFSLSRFTTQEEIDFCIKAIYDTILSPPSQQTLHQ